MTRKLNVIVFLRESSNRYRERLTDSDEIGYYFCNNEAEIGRVIHLADIVLGSIRFPGSILAEAGRLKWIQATAAGVDAFLATSRLPEGVLLSRADVAFGDQIGEYVIAHLLAHTQRLRDVYHLQREQTWQPLAVSFLKDWTLGVAGAGSIGQAVAKRARGMDMRPLGLARRPREIAPFDHVYGPGELEAFLAKLDALVICLPLTPETRGMFGANQLELLKPSALLVNVARGAIVDETALLKALQEKRLGGAILDVFWHEPLSPDHPFWFMDNVTITSHHAGLNVPDTIIDFFLENLRRFRSGEPILGLVDPDRGY